MSLINKQLHKVVLICVTSILLLSCANTKISQSWVDPDHKKTYTGLLIIGIAESESNRRAYESNFVEELSARGIKAEASYKLIKSNEEIDRNTIVKAIDGLGIDGVIITHLVAVDEETVYRPGMGYSYGGYGGYGGGMYGYYPHVNSYVQSPGYYTTHETYTIETNLYDVKS
jgi:hypothetical protein